MNDIIYYSILVTVVCLCITMAAMIYCEIQLKKKRQTLERVKERHEGSKMSKYSTQVYLSHGQVVAEIIIKDGIELEFMKKKVDQRIDGSRFAINHSFRTE